MKKILCSMKGHNNYNYKVSEEVKVTVKGKESGIDGLTKEVFTLFVECSRPDVGKTHA